jgi:hypothetical protein
VTRNDAAEMLQQWQHARDVYDETWQEKHLLIANSIRERIIDAMTGTEGTDPLPGRVK